jgi:phospho-N-acetylmuramoyl-pentapeptide-transferase
MLQNLLFSFILCLFLTVLFGPLVIKISKNFKFSQTILHYVEAHKTKQGTPTMGGNIFLFPIIVSALIFFKSDFSLGIVCLVIMLSFSIIGFLDDYIKIKFKQNEGLKAYQKIIGQVAISLLASIFAYNSGFVGSEIYIPFSTQSIDLGFFIIPFLMFVFIAVTNSVNLTDGLDGLASGVSLVYFLFFSILLYFNISSLNNVSSTFVNEQNNLLVVSSCATAGMLGYLCFNAYPAKIFMGDTGSLGIGGSHSFIYFFTYNFLFLKM